MPRTGICGNGFLVSAEWKWVTCLDQPSPWTIIAMEEPQLTMNRLLLLSLTPCLNVCEWVWKLWRDAKAATFEMYQRKPDASKQSAAYYVSWSVSRRLGHLINWDTNYYFFLESICEFGNDGVSWWQNSLNRLARKNSALYALKIAVLFWVTISISIFSGGTWNYHWPGEWSA